jgi:hypothetical protein
MGSGDSRLRRPEWHGLLGSAVPGAPHSISCKAVRHLRRPRHAIWTEDLTLGRARPPESGQGRPPGPGYRRIRGSPTGDAPNKGTVSEAQEYGRNNVPLMAGYTSAAKDWLAKLYAADVATDGHLKCEDDGPNTDTRPSDFMQDRLRAFAAYDPDGGRTVTAPGAAGPACAG